MQCFHPSGDQTSFSFVESEVFYFVGLWGPKCKITYHVLGACHRRIGKPVCIPVRRNRCIRRRIPMMPLPDTGGKVREEDDTRARRPAFNTSRHLRRTGFIKTNRFPGGRPGNFYLFMAEGV